MPEAIKSAWQICEDLGGWTGSARLQVRVIISISMRVD